MKRKTTVLLSLLVLILSVNVFAQLTADITVDDFQWKNSGGNPIDYASVFPGAGLTRFYAPLPVFFQGWKSEPRGSIADYMWDFGDGSEKFHGMNAGHVYEIPGNYTAILTVTDSLGNTDTETISIEVLEREGNIYYVDSEIGDDNNSGLSQTADGGGEGPWKSADRAFQEIAGDLYLPGDMVLFKRGQSFDLTVSGITPGVFPSWGYMFGAYGIGDKPLIQYKGTNEAIIIHMYSIGFAHISFVDLDFRFDDYAGHKAGVFFFAQGGGTRNILFLRVDALDLYSDLFVVGQYDENELSSGTFIFNSSIRNTYIDPERSVTLFAVWGTRVVIMNNYFDLSGNHIGYTAIDKGVVAGNTFSRPAFGRTALRICGFQETGDAWNTNLTSNNVQISENRFYGWIDPETVGQPHNGGGTRYNYLLVQLAPNGPWNQIIRDIVFERNIITNAEGHLNIGASENIKVRNNIFISDAPSGYCIAVIDANKPSKNINITGNTFIARNAQYTGNPYEMGGMVKILNNETQVAHPFPYSNHEDINLRNNIFYINGTEGNSRFLYINNKDEVLPEVKSDNNLFFVNQGIYDGNYFQIGDSGIPEPDAEYLTLDQWRSLTGNDISSVYGDPLFGNLNGEDGSFSVYGFDADLTLQTGSAAIGNGFPDKLNSMFDFNMFKRMTDDNTVDIGAFEFGSNTSISKRDEMIPERLELCQNYPNPFNPSTTIEYSIPVTLSPVTVSLVVYNLLGQEVATLVNQKQPAGNYKVRFNPALLGLASGIYIYRLSNSVSSIAQKMIYLK